MKNFAITHRFDFPLEDVVDAVVGRELLEHLPAALPKIRSIEVLDYDEEDGKIRRQVRFEATPLIERVGPKPVPPEWFSWIEESVFDAESKTLSFVNRPMEPDVAQRIINRGQVTFRREDDTTLRTISGQLDVRVFVLGRVAERLIYEQAARLLADEVVATRAFLSARAQGA